MTVIVKIFTIDFQQDRLVGRDPFKETGLSIVVLEGIGFACEFSKVGERTAPDGLLDHHVKPDTSLSRYCRL